MHRDPSMYVAYWPSGNYRNPVVTENLMWSSLDLNIRAETNTSSTRLPGSSKYPNYPIAGIRIR